MLKLHYLNVGKGHTTIIDFPSGRLSMIDVDDSRSFKEEDLDELAEMMGVQARFTVFKSVYGTKEARQIVEKAYDIELTDPIVFLQSQYPGQSLFRFILTHPDMDHLSGLDRLNREIVIANFWDTANNKTLDTNSWEGSPYRKQDWDTYQQLRRSEANPKCLRLERGASSQYWAEDGLEILSPSPEMVDLANRTGEYNHISYVFKLTRAGLRIFLGGDASVEALDDILECVDADKLKADVLIAPHHGSKSHFHKDLVKAISPKLILVSVAVGTDYAYAEYSRFGKVLATKWHGNISLTVPDVGQATYETEHARR